MKKNVWSLMRVIIVVICFVYSHEVMSQKGPATWQEQMELSKTKGVVNIGDSIRLRLVKYAYKGVIKSEAKKQKLVDRMFSKDAPVVFSYPPIIKRDTVSKENFYQINVERSSVFKIISIAEMREQSKATNVGDPTIKMKELLGEFIKTGYEYLEVEWDFNDRKFKSICIVSNSVGGVVYDNIASNIFTGGSKSSTTHSVRYHLTEDDLDRKE